MKRIASFKLSAITLILFVVINITACKEEVKRLPNIVIILTDDQGYADVGVFGATEFETPNLDRLASEGVRFTDFYVSEAVSTASRASLLTGCYAQRLGLSGMALNASSAKGLNPEEQSIASLLKQKDYSTGIFGKWHLGHHSEFLPFNHGFDKFFGLPYSNDMWPYSYEGRPVEKGRKSNYPPLRLIEDSVQLEAIQSLEDQSKLTALYTKHALDFIKENKENPFFLYLPHSMPHTPIAASPSFKGKSMQGEYGDVIMEIDWSVGEIMRTLEENNLDENTLIIFVSDNGPWLNFGKYAGSAFPLREGKGSMWEGGARVPCIMRWPGKIKANTECNNLAATIDILPTIAEISATSLSLKSIDGTSILPYLYGDTSKTIREHYAYYYGGQLCAVRQNDWKLYFPHKYRSYDGVEPGINGNPGPYNYKRCETELYNLRTDIREQNDIYASNSVVSESLKHIADSFRIILGDRLTGARGNEKRDPGRIGFQDVRYNHLGVGKAIELFTPLNPKYGAGGDSSFIDGYGGSFDLYDDRWLGFQGEDVVAIIDMGFPSGISSIHCSFLQSQSSWIFLPKELRILISDDGNEFEELYSKEIESEIFEQGTKTVNLGIDALSIETRYIQIVAKTTGPCPEWHSGYGDNTWLFVDEIVVR
jgi:arylsulfatase A-like enzyme